MLIKILDFGFSDVYFSFNIEILDLVNLPKSSMEKEFFKG